MLAAAGMTSAVVASSLAQPIATTQPTTNAVDSFAVAAASLAGLTATASAANDTIEVRDVAGNIIASISRAQMQALCPFLSLSETNDGPAGMCFSDSGRLLFIALTDTTVPGDGPSDAILRLDIDTGQLSLFARAELGGPDTSRPRVGLAHYKGRLYVGGTGVVMGYSATMNQTAGTALFVTTVSVGNNIVGITVDRPQNGLIVATSSTIYRAPITTSNSLTFSTLGTRSNIRAISFAEHFGGTTNPGLYILQSTLAPDNSIISKISVTQARGSGGFTPTTYLTIAEPRHDLAATAHGTLLLGMPADAEEIRDNSDAKLSYDEFLSDEFDQVVTLGRGLISPAGEPAGWVIDADVIPAWSWFHPASPDAACWTVLLLLMSDEVHKQNGGSGDPLAQQQVRTILQRYSGNSPDGIVPLRSADGIYWHWIDPVTGNAKSGWGDSYATMSTMKIVVAAARAAAYYPLDADIRRYARDIICNVTNWDAYFNSATSPTFRYQIYMLAQAAGGPDLFSGGSAFNESILFADQAAFYGGAFSDLGAAHWYNAPGLPSATLLTSRPVRTNSAGSHLPAFISLYPLLLLENYRASSNWQTHVRNLRASNAAWTDDNGPQFNTVFSAGTTYINGYNADSLSNHPGDLTTFTSLLAFAAGDGASNGRHIEAGGAYQAYRTGGRQTFKTGASILYRRSNVDRNYRPDSAGLPDVALGALGLAELLAPGSVARVLTGEYPSCAACPADLDNGSGTGQPDGGVDINDLLFFLAAFEAGSASADLDDGSTTGQPDGGVDINDLLYFLSHFEAGC
jgi:hypothetical protein